MPAATILCEISAIGLLFRADDLTTNSDAPWKKERKTGNAGKIPTRYIVRLYAVYGIVPTDKN